MKGEFVKPLTPSLRRDINASIESQIAELKTCDSNALVSAQICGMEACKRLFDALPDGYPITMRKKSAKEVEKGIDKRRLTASIDCAIRPDYIVRELNRVLEIARSGGKKK